MSLYEQKILKQVTILPDQSAINVQWANQIIKDGEVISEQLHRKAYLISDKEAFLSEVEDAESYLQILGWN